MKTSQKLSSKKAKPKQSASSQVNPKGKLNEQKTNVGATHAAGGKAYAKTKERDVKSILEVLDISSLDSDDVTSILLHCASALNLRKVIATDKLTMAKSSASYCYTKAGDSSQVSIWSGGFKVGETSQANAKASGIPPCG